MKVRTLIVDDEELARERLRQLLAEQPELELVGECADGREAVAAIQKQAPDLIFLDIQMPELDGFAVLDALVQFLERATVAGHQSHSYFEILRCRLLGEREHPAGGRTIRRQRLFHEDVEPLLNGVSKMDPAKRQRRGKDRNVAGFQAVHRLLVSVEPDELAVLGHIHQLGVLPFQSVVTALEPVIEDVGHGHELGRTIFDRQRVIGGATAAATAANQGDLDGVVPRRVNAWNGHSRQGRSRGNFA